MLRDDAVGVAHGSVWCYLFKEGLLSMINSYDEEHKAFDHTLVEAELAGTLLDYLCSCPNPNAENGKTWSLADAWDYPLLDYSLICWKFHTFAAKRIIPPAFEKFMQSPQHQNWWLCWSQDIDARGSLEPYRLCKLYLTHGCIHSFQLKLRRSSVLLGPIYLYVCLKKS